jgi:hypothetical protein
MSVLLPQLRYCDRGRLAPAAGLRLHRGAELGRLEGGAFLEQALQIAIAQVCDPPAGDWEDAPAWEPSHLWWRWWLIDRIEAEMTGVMA